MKFTNDDIEFIAGYIAASKFYMGCAGSDIKLTSRSIALVGGSIAFVGGSIALASRSIAFASRELAFLARRLSLVGLLSTTCKENM